jgi:hypothetical protein
MRPGWLAWAAFIFTSEKWFATDTDQDYPKTIEWCFPRRRFPIDLRFYFTYTPT